MTHRNEADCNLRSAPRMISRRRQSVFSSSGFLPRVQIHVKSVSLRQIIRVDSTIQATVDRSSLTWVIKREGILLLAIWSYRLERRTRH